MKKTRKTFQDKKISNYINFQIIFLSLLTGAVYLWTQSLFVPVHSEYIFSLPKTNDTFPEVEKNIFLIDSKKVEDDFCQKDKELKMNSIRCKKDIEPAIAETIIIEETKPEPKTTDLIKNPPQPKPIIIPKKVFPKPVVRQPVVHKQRCAHKNDHPSKSKTKGHHMDEDCCLDPDESKNPICAY